MPSYKDNKTGKWYCKFYYADYTGTRKQKCKRGFALKRDADLWERDFLQRLQGTPDMLFGALYDIYKKDMAVRLRPSTLDSRKNVFKKHILPYFKDKPVNGITPADIRKWQNDLMEKTYSPAYLDRINNALVTIFNFAVTYYNLPVNPCDRAGHMGKRIRSMKFWTLDQYRKALQHVTDPAAHAALQVLFYSGMRFGEMLALTPADLDFTEKTISVSKTYIKLKGKEYIGAPKTDNGFRLIHMPDAVMDELQSYIGKIYGIGQNDRIFTFTRILIRNTIRRASEAASVPYIRIHDLRHSHVSMLIDMGFNPHLIAARIGDTVQMVNNTYGHLYPDKAQTVADQLNKLF